MSSKIIFLYKLIKTFNFLRLPHILSVCWPEKWRFYLWVSLTESVLSPSKNTFTLQRQNHFRASVKMRQCHKPRTSLPGNNYKHAKKYILKINIQMRYDYYLWDVWLPPCLWKNRPGSTVLSSNFLPLGGLPLGGHPLQSADSEGSLCQPVLAPNLEGLVAIAKLPLWARSVETTRVWNHCSLLHTWMASTEIPSP